MEGDLHEANKLNLYFNSFDDVDLGPFFWAISFPVCQVLMASPPLAHSQQFLNSIHRFPIQDAGGGGGGGDVGTKALSS